MFRPSNCYLEKKLLIVYINKFYYYIPALIFAFCWEPLIVGITLTNPTELELDVDPLRLPPFVPPQWSKGKPGERKWCVVMGLVGFTGFPISPKTKNNSEFPNGHQSMLGAPKYHSFLLAAVLGVLDGFLPQALLDEFIFCKIRRGIKNKPVLILSSREKVLKLKNCLPLGEATLRQYLGVVRNMLHPHKNKPLCPYSSVTLCISKIHWSSLGNLAAHLKHGAERFFFLLGGGYWILGMISIPGKSLGHVFWVP